MNKRYLNLNLNLNKYKVIPKLHFYPFNKIIFYFEKRNICHIQISTFHYQMYKTKV